jgi:hypothetical protein
MLDVFRGEMTCDALLDLIDHLPSNSAFHAAIADDEDYARQVLELEEREGRPAAAPPRLDEFSPEVRALAVIADKLSYLASIQVARAGKTPPKSEPYPRPVTALDRVRRRRDMARHRSVVARLLPDQH